MSKGIIFKGNLDEGDYKLIKTTDGWVLQGETSYVGFDIDKPQAEWIELYQSHRNPLEGIKPKPIPTTKHTFKYQQRRIDNEYD